jgi:hypothetical protein
MGEWLIGVYVFVLASLVGFELITRVPPTPWRPSYLESRWGWPRSMSWGGSW